MSFGIWSEIYDLNGEVQWGIMCQVIVTIRQMCQSWVDIFSNDLSPYKLHDLKLKCEMTRMALRIHSRIQILLLPCTRFYNLIHLVQCNDISSCQVGNVTDQLTIESLIICNHTWPLYEIRNLKTRKIKVTLIRYNERKIPQIMILVKNVQNKNSCMKHSECFRGKAELHHTNF